MKKLLASQLVLVVTLAACGADNGGGQIGYLPQGAQSALDGNYATDCFQMGDASMKRTVTIGAGQMVDRTMSYSDPKCQNEGAKDEHTSGFEIVKPRPDQGPNAYDVKMTHEGGKVETNTAIRYEDGRFMFGDKTKDGKWDDNNAPDGFVDEGLKVVK